MADSFRSAGYDVETTDSTAHVFCSVLEKQIPVVLLGSGCDKKIAMANLVPMLKKCNKGVTIILVSDEESLPTIRTVRQEGIFYHALKPTGRDDTEEILSAVKCAFDKTERNERKQTNRLAAKQEVSPMTAITCAAAQMTKQASEELPEAIKTDITRESRQGEKKMRAKAAAILTALTIAIAGFVYCVFAATKGMKESGGLMIWAFLGFCALLAVSQLLPAFISMKEAKKVAAQRLQEKFAVDGEKQHAYAVFDKKNK
jgi:response regulator of citrate/malate metabolism